MLTDDETMIRFRQRVHDLVDARLSLTKSHPLIDSLFIIWFKRNYIILVERIEHE